MTSTEQNIFFELLRAAIWQHEADLTYFQSSDWQWPNILRTLDSHALLALAADAVMTVNDKLQADKQLSPMQLMAIMQHSASVAQTHYELNNAIIKSFSALQQAGCNPVLLKGQGLATLYPLRNTRSCGDIDIYVGLSEYDKACSAIRKMINSPEAEAAAEEEAHHYEIHDGKISYEIHRYPSVAGNQRYQERYYALSSLYLVPGVSDTVQIPTSDASNDDSKTHAIPVPALQYNVLYVFNHLCQHLWEGGVGIKQIIDWMLLLNYSLKSPDFSLARLKIDLKQIGLFRAWQILGGVLVYQLGYPKGNFPFWDEKKAMKSQTFFVEELLKSDIFLFNSRLDDSFRKMPHGWKRIKAAWHYYYTNNLPVSIISPSWAARRMCKSIRPAIAKMFCRALHLSK